VCTTCLKELNRQRLPARALANDLVFAPVPEELKGLTLAERQVVAIARLQLYVINLEQYDNVSARGVPGTRPGDTRRSDQHLSFKGTVIAFPQDPLSTYKAWPISPAELSDLLFVNFLRRTDTMPQTAKIARLLGVRRSKIRPALQYLIKNVTFRKVLFTWISLMLAYFQLWSEFTGKSADELTICEANLNAYPDEPGELPSAIRQPWCWTDSDAFADSAADHAGYVPEEKVPESAQPVPGVHLDNACNSSRPAEHKNDAHFSADHKRDPHAVDGKDAKGEIVEDGPQEDPIQHAAFVDVHGDGLTRQEVAAMMRAKLAAAQKGDCQPPLAAAVPHSGKFVDGLRTPMYWPAVLPELFPDAGGLHPFVGRDHRKTELSAEDYVDHLLRSGDPRWREHAQFAYVAFNLLQKKRIFRSCTQQIKAKRVQALTEYLPLLTEDHIQVAINDLRNAEYQRGYHSMDDICDPDVSGKLDLTDHSRLHQRKQVYSRNICLGLPDLFVTINPGDAQAPLFLRLAGESLQVDTDGFWKSFPSRHQRLLLAARNPVAATLYANYAMSAFFFALLGFRPEDDRDSSHPRGIFGEEVAAYSFHVEEQGRGTLHWHGFVWFKNRPSPPDLQRLLNDPAFRERVTQWLDTVIHRAEPQVEQLHEVPENKAQVSIDKVCLPDGGYRNTSECLAMTSRSYPALRLLRTALANNAPRSRRRSLARSTKRLRLKRSNVLISTLYWL
jgi:hypothetical protein